MKTRLRYTLIAGLAAVGLGLAGCGGGGGGNLSNEIRDLKSQLAAAQDAKTAADARATAAEAAKAAADAARATAEAAQAAAEAAQMAAETAQAAAEAAQAAAETERDAAVAAQMQAEADKMAAEAAQMQAEAAQATAEAAQMQAEAAQMAAEAAQATAEAERDTANAAAAVSEQARMDAEAARTAAEAARVAAEAARATAEAERDSANSAKTAAEAAQAEAEAAQATAEAAQATAEAAQATAEADAAAARAAKATAEAAQATAEAAQATAESNLATARSDLADEEAEVARLTALLGTTDDPDSVQGMLTAAQARVTELEGMIGSMDDAADAEGSLYAQLAQAKADAAMYKKQYEALKQQVDDDEMKVARDNRIKDATALSAAINVATMLGSDGIPGNADDVLGAPSMDLPAVGDTAPAMPDSISGITAKRDAAGMVTVTAASTPKIDSGSAQAGSSWTEVMLSRSIEDTAEDSIAVYTDIEAPRTWPITADYTGTGDARGVQVGGTGEAPLTEMMGTVVPPANGSFSYAQDATFPGRFRGIPGTFTCENTACAVSADADGDVAFAGEYRFVATDRLATYDLQDDMYTSFGWWLRKPETGAWQVRMFVIGPGDGTAVDATDNADATTPTRTITANYSGMAAGKYTTESFSAGVKTDADAGHFTADASLTATLNAGDGNDEDTLKGTIDGFELSGPSDASSWKVTLESTRFETDGVAGVAAGNVGVSFGGAKHANAGQWSAEFFEDVPTDAPKTVGGTFGAVTPGASLIGAFGAHKQ